MNQKRKVKRKRAGIYTWVLLLMAMAWLPLFAQEHPLREQQPLDGTWKFRLDPTHVGLRDHWQDSTFREEVRLPGTLEENKKGQYVTEASTQYLSQTYKYAGLAWYQREITVPSSWKGRHVGLFLERTKATWVWVDGMLAGTSALLSAPQVYDLTGLISPGRHRLTLLVDNTPALFPVGGSHALSAHTQTNWNGVLGRMFLQAESRLRVDWVKVSPVVKNKALTVQLRVINELAAETKVVIALKASLWNTPVRHNTPPVVFAVDLKGGDTLLNFFYPLGADALLWSEYAPDLYRLSVAVRDKKQSLDTCSVSFGLREFKASGTQFQVNGITTFLRGKNDCCVFPLTGHPPMDTAAWRRLYRIARSYGINHFRFHSYTPPEAAFEAADVEGVYLQCELPNWGDLTNKDTARTRFLLREGRAILDAYGNHPSFVLFTLGNELGGDKAVPVGMVDDFRNHDSRRLYASGSNAFFNDPSPVRADDFWVTMRTGRESPGRTFDVRGSFAVTEDRGSGILNSTEPGTLRNFAPALRGVRLPVIGHEVGQYQIYPDYRETSRYTGVLRPLNFQTFKKRLEQAGMGDQADDFFQASGRLTALLYREEIEMALRTPGFGGFQLLDLQDFPGQGTALVGLLNAFMENKGLISAEEFRRFNNDVVVQLLMEKYTWTSKDTFSAGVQLVNYSPEDLKGRVVKWSVRKAGRSRPLAEGTLRVQSGNVGKINLLGHISLPLGLVSGTKELTVRLSVPGTNYGAEYPLWVYPQDLKVVVPEAITVSSNLDEGVMEKLNKGGRVLLFPDHREVERQSVDPQFIPEFWNWLVFKGGAERAGRKPSAGTLGILTRPNHPMLRDFPTAFYTTWQWWAITKNARPLILDSTSASYRPIVQVIDNIDRNHKLGMIFEFRVGTGSLLVCMANLPALQDRPEARQLYYSILRYMASEAFHPQERITPLQLKELLLGKRAETN